MEREIRMAAKLYECRDAVKEILGEDYNAKIQKYMNVVLEIMKLKKIEAIPALLLLSKTEAYKGNDAATLFFMAAICEIIEPTKPEKITTKSK